MVYNIDTRKTEATDIECEYKENNYYYTGDVVMAVTGWQNVAKYYLNIY